MEEVGGGGRGAGCVGCSYCGAEAVAMWRVG